MAIVIKDSTKLVICIFLIAKKRKITITHLIFAFMSQGEDEQIYEEIRSKLRVVDKNYYFAIRDVKRLMSLSTDELMGMVKDYSNKVKIETPFKEKDVDIDDILESLF